MTTENENNVGQFPESLRAFEGNWTKKHPGKMPGYCHNVYQILVEDLDGNVVDEKFAVNCMTDYGLQHVYANADLPDSYYLFAGNGEGDIDPASSSMISLLSGNAATTYDSYEFNGQRFYPDIGMTVSRFRIFTGYFNYTHWSEDKTITEIGIGNNSNQLIFHAKIYDSEGNETTIVKKVNQRLTISVYVKMLTPIAEICNKAYENGCFMAFREYTLFRRREGEYFKQLYVNRESYYTRYNGWYDYTYFIYRTGGVSDHVYTDARSNIGSLYIEGKYDYMSDIVVSTTNTYYSDSRERYYSLFLALYRAKLETPLSIETDWFATDYYNTVKFDEVFGKWTDNHDLYRTGMLPVTDIEFQSLKMYNCQDHDYTIDVPYYQPTKSPKYDIGYLNYSIQDYNYIQHLEKEAWFRVYLNTAPDVPVKSFNISGVTFYATDAYWDSSTWEIIPNISDIPEELGTKRYYCMIGDMLPTYQSQWTHYGREYHVMPITRDQEVHHIIPKTEAWGCSWGWRSYNSSYNMPYDRTNMVGRCVSNDEYGYIASLNVIVFPDSSDPNPTTWFSPWIYTGHEYPYKYELKSLNNTPPSETLLFNTTRGGRILNFPVGSDWLKGCRVYTVTKDPSVEPTYEDFPYDTQFSSDPHISHTNNGYVVASYLSGANNVNKTYVFAYDVDEEDFEPTMFSVEGYHHCHAIDLTDYFCGVNASVTDHLSLDIYDMKQQEVVDTIDIPEGYAFAGMAGWKNFIYIRVNQTGAISTYVYYIQEKILTSTPLNLPQMAINGNIESHIQRSVEANGNCESCMVLCSMNDQSRHYVFKESDPLNPIALTSSNDSNTYGNVIRQCAMLKYVNDNKQLILVTDSYHHLTFDIGWILDNGILPVLYQYGFRTGSMTYSSTYNYKSYSSTFIYKSCIGTIYPYEYEYSIAGASGYYNVRQTINLYPYETHMNLQLKATTRTINSYHNPVQIGGAKGFSFSITNRNVESSDEPEEDS